MANFWACKMASIVSKSRRVYISPKPNLQIRNRGSHAVGCVRQSIKRFPSAKISKIIWVPFLTKCFSLLNFRTAFQLVSYRRKSKQNSAGNWGPLDTGKGIFAPIFKWNPYSSEIRFPRLPNERSWRRGKSRFGNF